jgi:hypothetical protein
MYLVASHTAAGSIPAMSTDHPSTSGTTAFAARALSVIGHPALLMPAAVAGSAAANGAPPRVLQLGLAASVAVAACVILYSLVQVRAGRWSHVDASVPRERSQLNLVLCMLLFGAAGLLWCSGQPRLLPLGLGLGGAMVVAAQLLRRRLKLSLHTAFAVYAAALWWPNAGGAAVVLLLAVAVSWSRLALRRHTGIEVTAGLLAGAAAGWVFAAFAR